MSYYILLYSSIFYCILLYSSIFYCILLYSSVFSFIKVIIFYFAQQARLVSQTPRLGTRELGSAEYPVPLAGYEGTRGAPPYYALFF